jgi:formylglycine-generating enzyme required for sulfatase activity
VQPVLDRHCIACHSGKADGSAPDLTDRPPVPTLPNKNGYNLAARFTPSYYELRRWVRTPTRESDMHLLPPWEFHADTTRLVQMLRKGHQGVRLDAEGWDRLITWIDLNAPAHGTWTAICGPGRVKRQWQRRREMRRRYAGMDDDPEAVYPVSYKPRAARPTPENRPHSRGRRHAEGWPFDAAEARRRQQALGPVEQTVDLGRGVKLTLVRIPAGEFVMGEGKGEADERPTSFVKIGEPFWMGRVEVTNEQFALFDPAHDSRLEHGDYIQFSPGERGWSLSRPEQPVVRVSWRAAMAFCNWLAKRTGRPFTLPTEAQWEWACRAGTATPLWYGKLDADFSRVANVSDAAHQAIDRFGWSGRAQVLPPWRLADARFNDGSRVSAPVGTYEPNPWGLCDMHGNVAEWTRSEYRPYPYADAASPRPSAPGIRCVVRGGSWYDRPARCRSAFRQGYLPDQGVYDVGFRVVCDVRP